MRSKISSPVLGRRKWLNAGNRVTRNTEVHRTVAFSPLSTSKLRVMCYSGPDHQPTFARINEIEVYETVFSPVAKSQTAAIEILHGGLEVQVWQPGKYELKTAGGTARRFEVASLPEPLKIAGSWQLRFPPKSERRKR